MSNSWLRLWHDMPNDPKWRTIARVSGKSIPAVLSVYLHLMVSASANADERGRTQGVNAEDIASALDLSADEVADILAAMQGRVMDGDYLTGWNKRQVLREDGAKERAKAWREAKKQHESAERTQTNADKRGQTPDKDTDTDKEIHLSSATELPTCPHGELLALFAKRLPELPQPRKSIWRDSSDAKAMKARWRWVLTACYESGDRAGQRMATNEAEALDWFDRFFAYVAKSNWLMGRDPSRSWNCTLPWLVKLENFAKVLSGNYDNKAQA